MRSKLGLNDVMPDNLLKVDHTDFPDSRVFDSMAEFWAYHQQEPLEEAKQSTSMEMVGAYIKMQLLQSSCDVKTLDEFSQAVEEEG